MVRPCVKLERVVGIEPTLSGRKHDILPLNYTRMETTFYRKSNRNGCFYIFGAKDGARTRYLCLGKASLYQMSYFRIKLLLNYSNKFITKCQDNFSNFLKLQIAIINFRFIMHIIHYFTKYQIKSSRKMLISLPL